MKHNRYFIGFFLVALLVSGRCFPQKKDLKDEVRKAMLNATKYMVDEVSANGGYVRVYLPDLSRQWGELEFYRTQIQIQSPGTTSMGHLFLDAYHATNDEYYYTAAEKVGQALVLGQLPCGGWNYMVDFAGDRSLKQWYNTIGKNAWCFEEWNHYYGNATFDDETTSNAAKFLLRLYLEKLDVKLKPALDKVINLMLEAQYPLGGWPQRYPLMYDFPHSFETDYTSFYTFNDDAIWGNIEFLIQCYATLGEERLLDPIRRGMNFYLITQQGNPQGGWGQQYNLELKPDHARTYEPAALCTGQTYDHVLRLLQFYKLTGERKFLSRLPDAIKWIESTKFSPDMTNGGKRAHPFFVEMGTNKPLWSHRTGTGVSDEHIWNDYDTTRLYGYGDYIFNTQLLWNEYNKVSALSPEEATKDSPLRISQFKDKKTPQQYYQLFWPMEDNINAYVTPNVTPIPDEKELRSLLTSLDNKNRWLSKHEWISDPYTVAANGKESNTALHSDPVSASWVFDQSEQTYISVPLYQKNMYRFISYLKSLK